MEVEPQVQASQVQPEPTPIDAAEANRRRLQEIEDQANLLLRMGKSCKVEAYKGSRAMGVLEVWIMRMNIHLSHFHVSDYIAGMFMRSYLTDKALTWYTTWERMLSERGATISWSGMQEGLLQNFQAVDSLQTARMKLWDLKQKGGIHEYIEEFRDLQVSIMDMSGAEALDVFKRGLKDRIRKEVMVSNPSTVNEAIAIAQRISGAFGVTHGEPVSNFRDPSGPTPMELGNLRRREGFAPTRGPPPRFGGEIRRPGVPNLQEGYANNGMVRGGAGVRDNRQCYACGRMGHIAKFCRVRPTQQGGWLMQRRPFNNMEGIEYEEVEEAVSGNEDHQ